MSGGRLWLCAGRKDGVADIVCEGAEDDVVVLEECVTWEFEKGVSDAFANGGFVVCDADVLGGVVWGGGVDGCG